MPLDANVILHSYTIDPIHIPHFLDWGIHTWIFTSIRLAQFAIFVIGQPGIAIFGIICRGCLWRTTISSKDGCATLGIWPGCVPIRRGSTKEGNIGLAEGWIERACESKRKYWSKRRKTAWEKWKVGFISIYDPRHKHPSRSCSSKK